MIAKPPDLTSEEWSEVTRLNTLLARHVIPLFRKGSGKRPEPVGSGFLVSSGEMDFLVSAAHVLDEIEYLHFYIEPGLTRKLTGRPTTVSSNTKRISSNMAAASKSSASRG